MFENIEDKAPGKGELPQSGACSMLPLEKNMILVHITKGLAPAKYHLTEISYIQPTRIMFFIVGGSHQIPPCCKRPGIVGLTCSRFWVLYFLQNRDFLKNKMFLLDKNSLKKSFHCFCCLMK